MIDLYDAKGGRKYLNATERSRFEVAAREEERAVRTFCLMLLYSGCRISEALALTVKSIDFPAKSVVLRTLKKRGGKPVYRSVPLPDHYLDELNLVHNLKKEKKESLKIWSWSRATASRKVDAVMQKHALKAPRPALKASATALLSPAFKNRYP